MLYYCLLTLLFLTLLNINLGTCAQTVNNEKGKASKPRDSKKKGK